MNYIRCIQSYVIGYSCRKTGRQFLHLSLHSFWNVQRIGARLLIDSNRCGRHPLQSWYYTIRSRPQIYSRNIFQAKHCPILFPTNDNIPELLRRSKSPLYIKCILKGIFIVLSDRLTDIAGGHFHILRLNGLIYLRRRNIPDAHGFRIQPDTHGIITCSHNINSSYARHTW